MGGQNEKGAYVEYGGQHNIFFCKTIVDAGETRVCAVVYKFVVICAEMEIGKRLGI
jgi:hypothetical protein